MPLAKEHARFVVVLQGNSIGNLGRLILSGGKFRRSCSNLIIMTLRTERLGPASDFAIEPNGTTKTRGAAKLVSVSATAKYGTHLY